LRAGADPNRVAASTGSTPLHDALVGGHHEIIKLLLEFRAKQTQCDDKGMTPLHVCCVNNDVMGARLLLQHKDARKALMIADRRDRTPRMACSRKHLQDVIERKWTSSCVASGPDYSRAIICFVSDSYSCYRYIC
jgi:ankyrin repeat protein